MRLFTVLSILTLTGCSTAGSFTSNDFMQSAIGHTIAEIAVQEGPPASSFDMGDGRRAFQWVKSDTVASGGHARVVGSMILSSPVQVSERSCNFTFYATGGVADRLSTWKIVGYEPNGRGCN